MTEDVEQNQSLNSCPHYSYVYTEDHHHCVNTTRTHPEAYGQLKWALAQERQYSAYLKDKVHKLEKEVLCYSQNTVHTDSGGDKRPRRDVELEAANKQLKLAVANLRDEVQKLTLEKEKMVQDYQRYVKQLNQVYTAKLEMKENGCRKLQERLQQLSQQLEQIHDLLPSNIALVPPLPLEDDDIGNDTEDSVQKQLSKPGQECLMVANVKKPSICHRPQFISSHNTRFSPPTTHHVDYQPANGVTCTEKRTSDSQLGTLSCTSSSTEIDSVSEHSLSPSKETTLLVQYLKSTPSKYGHLPSPAISETSSTDIPCHCNLSNKFSPCVDFTPSAFTSVIRPKARALRPSLKPAFDYTNFAGDQAFIVNNCHSQCDVHHSYVDGDHGSIPIACCKDLCEPEHSKHVIESVPTNTQNHTTFYMEQNPNAPVPNHSNESMLAQNKNQTTFYLEQNHNVPVRTVREITKTLNNHKTMCSPTFITEERLKPTWTCSEENVSIFASPLPQNINELAGCSSTDSGLAESLDVVSSAAENDDHDPTTYSTQTSADDVVSAGTLENEYVATCCMNTTSPNNAEYTCSKANIFSRSTTTPVNKGRSTSSRCRTNTPSPTPDVGNVVSESNILRTNILNDKQGPDKNLVAPEFNICVSCTEVPHGTKDDISQNVANSFRMTINKDVSSDQCVNVSPPPELNLQQNEKVVAGGLAFISVERGVPAYRTCQSSNGAAVHNISSETGSVATVDLSEKSTLPSRETTVPEINKTTERSTTPCSSTDNLSQSSRNSSPAVTTMPRMRARIKSGRSSTDSDASCDSPKIGRHVNVSTDKNMTDGAVQKTLEALGLGC